MSDVFSSGSVWEPLPYPGVRKLQEEMAAFPYGGGEDLHDAAVWDLLRIRRGGLRIATEEEDGE